MSKISTTMIMKRFCHDIRLWQSQRCQNSWVKELTFLEKKVHWKIDRKMGRSMFLSYKWNFSRYFFLKLQNRLFFLFLFFFYNCYNYCNNSWAYIGQYHLHKGSLRALYNMLYKYLEHTLSSAELLLLMATGTHILNSSQRKQ